MILDPEMRTLLKQLADNTGRLARAVEAVLDAEKIPTNKKTNYDRWQAHGGRVNVPLNFYEGCTCELCAEPWPWCDRCSSYHHESAPHVR